MNVKDVIETFQTDTDHTELQPLIDFLENAENHQILFNYWNSLNDELNDQTSNKIFAGIVGEIVNSDGEGDGIEDETFESEPEQVAVEHN